MYLLTSSVCGKFLALNSMRVVVRDLRYNLVIQLQHQDLVMYLKHLVNVVCMFAAGFSNFEFVKIFLIGFYGRPRVK